MKQIFNTSNRKDKKQKIIKTSLISGAIQFRKPKSFCLVDEIVELKILNAIFIEWLFYA